MEMVDLYDENRLPLGRTAERYAPKGEGEYRVVVHICVFDSRGRLLIQKRASHLKLMPGIWAATGGSAIAGEESEAAARRELFEELGIPTKEGELRRAGRIRRRNSFTDIWILRRDVELADLRLQAEEVADAAWVTREELIAMVADRRFHHYGRPYFDLVLGCLCGKERKSS